MKYIKFICSNGFSSCNEEFYEEVEDNIDIDNMAQEILVNKYSFYELDERFLTDSSGFGDEDYDEFEEDYDEYMENLDVYWEEITKEEYKENALWQ